MSKELLTSDLHFHKHKNIKKNVPVEVVFDVWNQIEDYCLKNRIKRIRVLGDTFHVRGKIPVGIFNMVSDRFEETTKKGIEICLLSGNHDHIYDEEESTTSIYTLKKIKGIRLLDWSSESVDECNFVSIPYISNKRKFQETLEEQEIVKGKANILLTHGTIKSAMLNSKKTASDGIDLDKLKKFDYVCAGHIHHPQKLYEGMGIELGSPLCHSKKDIGSPQRGFWIIDCEKVKFEFVPTKYPKFQVYNITSQDDISEILKEVTKEDYIYLSISPKIDEIDLILKKFSKHNAEFIIQQKPKVKARLDVALEDPEEKIIEEYIQKFGEGLDSSFLNKLANELVEESKIIGNDKL